jgi:chromosome segregation ATPase
MIGQAQSLLDTTRQRVASMEKKYNYAKKNAEDADRLLQEIMARKLNSTSYQELGQQHQHYQGMVRDFRDTIWDRARAGSLAAKNQSQLAKAELDRLERTIQEIGQFGQLAEEELANGRQNVGQTGQLGTEIGQIGKVPNEWKEEGKWQVYCCLFRNWPIH